MDKYKLLKSIIINGEECMGDVETKDQRLSGYGLSVDSLGKEYFQKIEDNQEGKIFSYFMHGDKHDAYNSLIEDGMSEELAEKLCRTFEEIEIKFTIENGKIKFLNYNDE